MVDAPHPWSCACEGAVSTSQARHSRHHPVYNKQRVPAAPWHSSSSSTRRPRLTHLTAAAAAAAGPHGFLSTTRSRITLSTESPRRALVEVGHVPPRFGATISHHCGKTRPTISCCDRWSFLSRPRMAVTRMLLPFVVCGERKAAGPLARPRPSDIYRLPEAQPHRALLKQRCAQFRRYLEQTCTGW